MNRQTRLIVGIGAILFGSFQIYKAVVVDKQKKQKTQKMMDDLYQYQQEQRIQEAKREIIAPSTMINIDSIQEGLDSLKSNLDKIGESIESLND